MLNNEIKVYIFLFYLLNCITIFSQNREANDCINAIQICGNQTIELNPKGIGIQEIDRFNTCNGFENNSLWLRITVKEAGTLGFDLIPESTDLVVDYDFWIFGPNANCNDKGFSIRCSTTNPLASGGSNNHTGLRDSEPNNDFFEGPGAHGDGYIKSLDVQAGESYYLVIDRPIGDGAFKLNWTGTAILVDPFNAPSNKPFNIPDDIMVCSSANANLFDFSVFTNDILNSNTGFTVSYYENIDNAYYKENPIIGEIGLKEQSYYYRIQSDFGECFQVHKINVAVRPLVLEKPVVYACDVNNEGVFNLNFAVFTDQSIGTKKFYATKEEAILALPNTEIQNPQAYRSKEGKVYVNIVSTLGCVAISEVTLNFYPSPIIDLRSFSGEFCDDNLDGIYEVNLSEITKQIVPNSEDFLVSYYLKSNLSKALSNKFSYSDTTDLVVEVKSKDGCYAIRDDFKLTLKSKIIFPNILPFNVCDEDLDGQVTIDFSDFHALFPNLKANFYRTRANANQNTAPLNAQLIISKNEKIYVRLENGMDCPVVGEIDFVFKSSLASKILEDKVVCIKGLINLDAGNGYDTYLWSTGSTVSTSGLVGKGNYYVDLGLNVCTFRQYVNVEEEDIISIDVIDVESNRVTINASGGSKPYQYSIDGKHWQNSNTFENVNIGVGNIYVKSNLNCTPIHREFYNINLVNTITPNGDSYNDVLDFSGLRLKNDVKMKIVDRYGKTFFDGEEKTYLWDGKVNGRVVPTGTYWYVLKWTEPDTGLKIINKSWVLVKNK